MGKRKNWLDGNYHHGDDLERKKSKKSHGNLLNILTDSTATFTDKFNQEQPVKFAVSISKQDVLSDKSADIENNFNEAAEKKLGKKFFRQAVSPRNRVTGSPKKKIFTPEKTSEYHLWGDYGFLTIFSNYPRRSTSIVKSLESTFDKSAAYDAVKKPSTDHKEAHITVSKEIIEANKENHDPHRNQNAALAEKGHTPQECSASNYFEAATGIKSVRNWGHLNPEQVNGKKTTQEANLVNIGKGTNTRQLNIETQAIKLASDYPEVDYQIRANLIKDPKNPQILTHIPETMTGKIATPDFTLQVKLDPNDDAKPHRKEFTLLNLFRKAVVSTHQQSCEEIPSISNKL